MTQCFEEEHTAIAPGFSTSFSTALSSGSPSARALNAGAVAILLGSVPVCAATIAVITTEAAATPAFNVFTKLLRSVARAARIVGRVHVVEYERTVRVDLYRRGGLGHRVVMHLGRHQRVAAGRQILH